MLTLYFWNVTSCLSSNNYRRFEAPQCLVFRIDLARNNKYLSVNQHSRGPEISRTVCKTKSSHLNLSVNRLTPNDLYISRTTPLTSKRCILYIYSTNIGTEYFKHSLYSSFISLQNAVCFIMLTSLVPVIFTFYIQCVLKLKKKIIPSPKG